MAPTAGETAWRHLRCGAFVTAGPHDSGPAPAAPLLRRGKELRGDLLLRTLRADRRMHGPPPGPARPAARAESSPGPRTRRTRTP